MQHDVSERAPLLGPIPRRELEHEESGPNEDFPDEGGNKTGRFRGICISLSLGLLIVIQTSNISLISAVQSPIADDLDAYTTTSWFTSAYLIAMSSITPVAGRLCQIFLPQNYIFVSSIIFAIGLIITSSAQGLPQFLVGRVLSGIGAAGNFPVGIILATSASEKKRGLLMGLLNTGFTVGVAFGAAAAGALEPLIGWRAIFWYQTPFSIIAGLALFFALPTPATKGAVGELPFKKKLATIDYLGVLLMITFIVLLLFGFSAPKVLPIPIIVSFAFLAAFIWVEARYATFPIVPMTVLKSRGVLLTCVATLLLMMARWSVLFYTPVFAIAVRFWSPGKAGSILFATNGGFAIGGILVGSIHIRRAGSFFLACLITFVLFAASLFVLAQTATNSGPIYAYILCTFVIGAITGAALNYSLVHMLHLVRPEDRPIATSLLAMFRGFAGSFGAAIGGSIFMRTLQASLERGFQDHEMHEKTDLIRRLLGSPQLVGTLSGVDKEVAQQGYVDAIKILFVTGGVLGLVATLVQAGVGWNSPEAPKSDLPGEDESVDGLREAT